MIKPAEVLAKPLLRGWSHAAAALGPAWLAWLLLVWAPLVDHGGSSRAAAVGDRGSGCSGADHHWTPVSPIASACWPLIDFATAFISALLTPKTRCGSIPCRP